MKLRGFAFFMLVFGLSIFSVDAIVQTAAKRMFFSDFTNGSVLFKDGTKTAAMLNYDTFEEQMIFKNGNEIMALASPELISSIKINDHVFEWLEGDIFLEKIDNPSVLIYKRNRNQLMSKGKGTAFGGVSNTSSVQPVNNLPRGYDKQGTELSVNEDFELMPDNVYYTKGKTGFRSLASSKQFCKAFGGDKKDVTKYIQTNKMNLQNVDDVLQVIEYCTNNR